MSFLDKFLFNFDFQITEGGKYNFAPYGNNVYHWNINFEDVNLNHLGSIEVIFDPKTKKIFQYSTFDADRSVEYVWYEPSVREAAIAESKRLDSIAPADFSVYETDSEDDIFAKAHAIKNEIEYDHDVVIDLTVTPEMFMACCQAAHKMDVTLNEFLKKVALDGIKIGK